MKKRQEGGARRTRVRQGVFLALRRTIKKEDRLLSETVNLILRYDEAPHYAYFYT